MIDWLIWELLQCKTILLTRARLPTKILCCVPLPADWFSNHIKIKIISNTRIKTQIKVKINFQIKIKINIQINIKIKIEINKQIKIKVNMRIKIENKINLRSSSIHRSKSWSTIKMNITRSNLLYYKTLPCLKRFLMQLTSVVLSSYSTSLTASMVWWRCFSIVRHLSIPGLSNRLNSLSLYFSKSCIKNKN